MSKPQAQVPPPKLTPPAPPAPPPEVSRGIELIEPVIELLTLHIFVRPGDRTNTNRLTPKRAFIVGAAIVIDEMNLILPLSNCLIRTKG